MTDRTGSSTPQAWTLRDRVALHEVGIADDPTTQLNRHPLRPRPEAATTSWWQSTVTTAQAASLGVALVARTVFRARPNR